jgi:hypothetical protein
MPPLALLTLCVCASNILRAIPTDFVSTQSMAALQVSRRVTHAKRQVRDPITILDKLNDRAMC